MKIIKKISLVFLGLLGALIVLELSMQTAGFIILKYQNYENNKTLSRKTKYTIVCIGESTTSGGYPKYLQGILNKKYPNKFSVIDSGVPGIYLENILSKLDMDIAKYKPDFAICMMGINDGFISFFSNHKKRKNKKYGYLKLYKLYELLREHLKAFFKIKEVYTDNPENLDYAYQLYFQKKYSDAERVCEIILKTKKYDYYVYAFLVMLDYYHLNKKDIAYEMALNIIETNKEVPGFEKQLMYGITIDYSLNKNDIELGKQYVDKLINDKDVILNPSIYLTIKDLITSEQKAKFFQKMSACNETLDQYYGLIAIESMDGKNYKKSEEYFAKAEDIRLKYPNEKTYKLYKLILKKLTDKNIKVICMQYPVRSVELLKHILKNEQYYNKIKFISNENNFKDLLKKKKYNEIFYDQFAGDFGHCLSFGNRMIAENIVKSLENLLN